VTEDETRRFLVEQLRRFYERGWISGTGGGICGPADGGALLVAPTGVHKELVAPDELFTIDPRTDSVLVAPAREGLRPSECGPIFSLIARERGARSVVHTHALSAVLFGDLAEGGDHVTVERLEMLKGIRGFANTERHEVPVIRNTPRELELVEHVTTAIADPRFARTFAVVVEDHGVYVWGSDVWETKRHTETYHYLFEATVARHDRRRNRKE
jgi:ribulose-5-phosphate 4-epimerase/fuculose-1-phosphate aldolase